MMKLILHTAYFVIEYWTPIQYLFTVFICSMAMTRILEFVN